jgi:hypothetical protein
MVAWPGAGRHQPWAGHAVCRSPVTQRARMNARSQNGRIASEADAQVVAGTWMISCVDDNPGLIYHSVASRLNTNELQIRKIAKDWRELFRPGINPQDNHQKRLETLKSEIGKINGLTPEQHKELKNKDSKLEDWCFRSQFRTNLSDPKSPLDEIQLGLAYIETHRKAYLEFAEKKRQQSVYWAPLLTILATLVLGLLALAGNVYIGHEANNLKVRELDMKASEIASKQQDAAKPSPPAPPSPTR